MTIANDFSSFILTAENQLSVGFENLLVFFLINPNQTLQELVSITQKLWLRPNNIERWHIQDKNCPDEKLRKLFARIGMIDAVYPESKHYDYVILLGSDLFDMQLRAQFLFMLWAQGVCFQELIVLSSDRPLESNELNHFEEACTEMEMIKAMLKQFQIPEEFPPISYIEARGQKLINGILKRATTKDTLDIWISQKNPQPGACLIISNQPFCGYQYSVACTILSSPLWHVSCSGPKAECDISIQNFCDSLTRWLYQEKERRHI